MDRTSLVAQALRWVDAGCSIVPTRADGTKAPIGEWGRWQQDRPSRAQVQAWLNGGAYDGYGIVCGAVSGVEMLELEGRAVAEDVLGQLQTALTDHGHGELLRRLAAGYLEGTPGGGLHLIFRVADGEHRRNLKLAARPATPAELAANPHDRLRVLIETRGEGGYVVVAPSGGRTHPSGGSWTLVSGGPERLPILTSDERDALYAIAGLLDSTPHVAEPAPDRTTSGGGGMRPGDDFEARADWHEILVPHGWRPMHRIGDGMAWCRPGKASGISATTDTRGPRLYVFSTSTQFEAGRPYGKFAAYAVLMHGGDYAAAAGALRREGYGDPLRAALAVSEPAPVADTHELADDGNARRLIDRHGHRIRYVAGEGWLTWTGSRWEWDRREHVAELARETILALPCHDPALVKFRRESLDLRHLSAMVRVARSDPRVNILREELDRDPDVLCTPTGIVDLRTGKIRPAQPEDLCAQATAVHVDATTPTPRWQAFLADTFAGHEELIPHVQRLAGLSATGHSTAVMPFLLGDGQNGKSVFCGVMMAILGDYAVEMPEKFLEASGTERHATEVAMLRGMRFALCSESNKSATFNEARLKSLTGGDRITARFMRQDHFSFSPTHHLWYMANSQPRVPDGGNSFWRRVQIIPFSNTVPPARRVQHLDALMVAEEGAGIMAWVVEGAVAALAEGLLSPDIVQLATAEYAVSEDALGRWAGERLLIGGGEHVVTPCAAIYADHVAWCRRNGEENLTANRLGRDLRRLGIGVTRTRTARSYTNVCLMGDDTADDE